MGCTVDAAQVAIADIIPMHSDVSVKRANATLIATNRCTGQSVVMSIDRKVEERPVVSLRTHKASGHPPPPAVITLRRATVLPHTVVSRSWYQRTTRHSLS